MSKLHELKSAAGHFNDIWSSRRTFEVRKNDREYAVNDVLRLMEIDADGAFTGRECLMLVLTLMRGSGWALDPVRSDPDTGIAKGWVVMSLKLLTRVAPQGATTETVGPQVKR